MNRINVFSSQVIGPTKDADAIAGSTKIKTVHEDAWGYKDTQFKMNPSDGCVSLSGDRYLYSGKRFPNLYPFIQKYGVDKDIATPAKNIEAKFFDSSKSTINESFLESLRGAVPNLRLSVDPKERVMASHGHTVQEIWALRFGKFSRIVDAVIYPESHEEVEKIVRLADQFGVAVLPYGGGTTVSHSLLCNPNEKRMILAIAVSRMNSVLTVNRETMCVRVQAGCVGSHLEKALGSVGLTLGHEPDSWEFSTVGGWIATRASGMKKNIYGNIEDLLVDVKVVTPIGTLTRGTEGIPRMSAGPDILQMVLGSEGSFGVITEAVLKVRPAPEAKTFGSLVFPSFEDGLRFMREVARRRIQPASIRLMDNTQFLLGSSLKPEQSIFQNFLDSVIRFYVLRVKKFDPENICAVTMSFEGTKSDVAKHESMLNSLATSQFNGLVGGAGNGIRGYFLTFVIAYLRDFGLQHQFIAESFETSVPWDKVDIVIRETKAQVLADCKAAGIAHEPMISARVTQTYDSGAAVYFYLGMSWKGLNDPVATYSQIEDRARECVMKHGGSISHHHGVGKIRKQFMDQAVGSVGKAMIKGLKTTVDPRNIFSNGNLV